MFSNKETHKILYKETLQKINAIGTRIQNDTDKIYLLGLINNLKYHCSDIEPQDSYDMYNK
jgi:hypothetical protein